MVKICGKLQKVFVKETKNGAICKITIKDENGGDYAPTHYVDDFDCRNWQEAKGQYVEIPCTIRVNGSFLNLNPLDSVQVAECVGKHVKAV